MKPRFLAWVCGVVWAVPAGAQTPPRFGIADNSFLVEEAFNQEKGIFQNIFVVARGRDGRWNGVFTQEWPLGGLRHQLSLSVPFAVIESRGTAGDLLVNYRYQLLEGADGRLAFAPRVSAVLATSVERRPLALAGTGWQVNLPFSKQAGPVYLHWNAGATWLQQPVSASTREWNTTPFAAASVIWGLRSMVHPMIEVFTEWPGDGHGREATVTVLPGLRGGWNLGDRQLVLGVGVPITRGGTRDHGVLMYASFELPFSK